MTGFSIEITLLMAAIAGASILSVLGTLASLIRNTTEFHDLTVAAAVVRNNYAKQLAEAQSQGLIDVDRTAEPAGPVAAASGT